MKDKFADRLVTVTDNLEDKEGAGNFGYYYYNYFLTSSGLVRNLEASVFQAGRSLNLVLLDCPASFPGDLDSASRLHPLFICVQVARHSVSNHANRCFLLIWLIQVLEKLVRQITTSSREKAIMLDCADQLSKSLVSRDFILGYVGQCVGQCWH